MLSTFNCLCQNLYSLTLKAKNKKGKRYFAAFLNNAGAFAYVCSAPGTSLSSDLAGVESEKAGADQRAGDKRCATASHRQNYLLEKSQESFFCFTKSNSRWCVAGSEQSQDASKGSREATESARLLSLTVTPHLGCLWVPVGLPPGPSHGPCPCSVLSQTSKCSGAGIYLLFPAT